MFDRFPLRMTTESSNASNDDVSPTNQEMSSPSAQEDSISPLKKNSFKKSPTYLRGLHFLDSPVPHSQKSRILTNATDDLLEDSRAVRKSRKI